jgi:hypothetical protein
MEKYAGRLGVVLLVLGGLTFLLPSCEKELEREVNENIKITFTLGDSSYGEYETVTRGVNQKEMKPETVMVPIGGGLRMHLMLAEDENSLRDMETIPDGTKLRIVAYNSSNAYVDDVEYTVQGGGIVGATYLELPSAGTYTFVAYSLNNTSSVPAYAASIGPYSADSHDPLCGSVTVPVVEGANNVTITMKHMFSKVKVTATTSGLAGTPTISEIDALLPGFTANLDVPNAALTKNSAENQTFIFPPIGTPVQTVTSDERKVYAGGEANTYIKITSVKIDGTEYTGLVPARFNKLLEAGKSYTLTASFSKVQFAGSNIYWDGNRLTFKGTGYVGLENYYNGVVFKWGSLVGVSTALPNGDRDFHAASTPIYVPTYTPGNPATSAWLSPTTVLAQGWNDWLSIPVDLTTPPSVGDRYSTYLMDDERNTPANWQAMKGDICRFISENGYGPGGNYRMPTAYEFSETETCDWGSAGWERLNMSPYWQAIYDIPATYTGGTYPIYNAVSNNGLVLPAAGIYNGNIYYNVGSCAFYWSGSAQTTWWSYVLVFDSYTGYLWTSYSNEDPNDFQYYARSVRCVKY